MKTTINVLSGIVALLAILVIMLLATLMIAWLLIAVDANRQAEIRDKTPIGNN